jgi:hypothetical protein
MKKDIITPEDREDFILTMSTVLFIDLLGVTEATKVTASTSVITPLVDLEFLWDTYLRNLAEVYPEITIYGGSDSIIIVGGNYHEIIKIAAWIFQICWVVRRVKMRAGIDIGNFTTSKNYQKSLDKANKATDNFYQPPYYIGDGLTHAVLAEKKPLKGNRIAIGEELQRHLEQYNQTHPDVNLWREEAGFPFEIRWDKIELAYEVQKKMVSKFPVVYRNYFDSDSIKHNFNNCLTLVTNPEISEPEKAYYRKMIDIGKAWGILE